MVTALCNVFINSEVKLELFKVSISRVFGVSDNWLVYIRGKHAKGAVDWMKKLDSRRQVDYFYFDDWHDWVKNSVLMLEVAKHDYVYIYLEDHFLLKPISHFKKIVREIEQSKIDYVQYSFFGTGLGPNNVAVAYPGDHKYLYDFILDKKIQFHLEETSPKFYPFSLTSICTTGYLRQLSGIEGRKKIEMPMWFQVGLAMIFPYPKNRNVIYKINNFLRFLKIKINFFSQRTPFNLERSLWDLEPELLGKKMGILKEELFANWDDDNTLPNSSLIKRGLYPLSIKVISKTIPRKFPVNLGHRYKLNKNEVRSHRFYPEISRISKLPTMAIKVITGELILNTNTEKFVLLPGKTEVFYSNIHHTVRAEVPTEYLIYYH